MNSVNSPDAPEFEQRYSKAIEDFLKAVYALQRSGERVSTGAMADYLGLKPPSVTDMARRLQASGLVNYRKHRGVTLTTEGEAEALKIIRRHRLIELYLAEELGYAPYEVHDEAERLEHAVSERFVEEIARKLGDPTIDPHGDPIPDSDGTIIDLDLSPLAALPANATGTVARLDTKDHAMHRHILERGLHLDTRIKVIRRDPFDGPITVLVDGEERVIGSKAAGYVLVDVAREDEKEL